MYARACVIGSYSESDSNAVAALLLSGRDRCRFRKLESPVSMVEPAKDRTGDNLSVVLDRACERCILSQRNMRSHLIVVSGVFRKNSSKVFCVEYDQMIRALASDRPDQAFRISILPRRPERRWPVPDTHRSDTSLERDAECLVIVANEIFRRRVPWERFSDLARQPLGRKATRPGRLLPGRQSELWWSLPLPPVPKPCRRLPQSRSPDGEPDRPPRLEIDRIAPAPSDIRSRRLRSDGMTEKISGQENQGRNSAIHRLWREVTATSARPYAGMYTHASVSIVSMIE
jgi:ribosomal protein L34E